MLKKIAIIAIFTLATTAAFAQIFDTEREEVIIWNGHKVPVSIKGTDTIILAGLDPVEIKGTRLFKNDLERYRFNQMRYNAKKVLPYAVEFIKIYQDVQAETREMKMGKKRKRVHDVQKELQDRFEKPLKNLYRSQGTLLIKMLERETDRNMYSVIEEYKGGFTAFYWNTFSYFYDYNLKEGYSPTKDPLMESVLSEFDIKALVAEKRRQEAAAGKQ
jgi:hypothetical protein